MGCGVSKDSTTGVLGNTVTQNGSAHPNKVKAVETSSSNGTAAANGVVTESVNLQAQELEEAATVIQARYRGYATRKHQQEEKEGQNQEDEPGLKEVEEDQKEEPNKGEEEEEGKKIDMANQEEEVDIDLNDPGVGSAAVKIQASFRGHQVRRQQEKAQAKADADAELAEQMQKLKTAKVEEEEELPDLNDPEIHKAATKIQAQFKGHMVRKKKEDDASK